MNGIEDDNFKIYANDNFFKLKETLYTLHNKKNVQDKIFEITFDKSLFFDVKISLDSPNTENLKQEDVLNALSYKTDDKYKDNHFCKSSLYAYLHPDKIFRRM